MSRCGRFASWRAAQPGEARLYHTGLDVAGVLIARASGRALGDFMQEHIFGPLNMKDTGFLVSRQKHARLATLYRPDYSTEKLTVFDEPHGLLSRPPAFESGGAGLVSTVDDYLAFLLMMLMIPKGYEAAPAGTMPDAEHVAAMMKYNEELKEAGVLIALDGLHPPSMGARVTFTGGKPTVTDGPFIETKEVLGGYWMIQVRSKEEAIEWARRCPAQDNEVIEVRQVQEFEDFPADVQKAAGGLAEMQSQSEPRGES